MATPQNREIPMICPYHARVDDARPCVQVDRTTDRIRKRQPKPNPVHNMPDRNMPADHDTTTNPQNTNNPTHNDNQPPSDEPLRPPGSTDQIRNRNHKTNPVHNRPTSRVPTDHGTTAKPLNTKEPTGTPASQRPEPADRTANHTTTSEPVHTDARQHRATNHDTTTKPRNTNNPHTPR
ncbi:hypothetical protein CQR47_0025 [Bifidobacterium thermophilum]|uniref:Uncharacterized protein n=1 Tax=Bifidobacterium thermophilum TaxID=33905 RepID=A0A2N3QPS5_9BIFI|nr:hypothetical protein CQR47_0025 [Bifidobacterium thermophilum]